MPAGRQDTLVRGANAAAVAAAPRVQAQAAVPLPAVRTGVSVAAPRVAVVANVPTVGAGDPTPFPMRNVVAANALYTGHPTTPNSNLRQSINFFDDQLAAAIGRPVPVHAGPHGYSGSSWPATFAQCSVSWADDDGWPWAILNVKTGGVSSWPALRDGTAPWTDSFIDTFVDSVPSSVRVCFTANHEASNDGTQPDADGGTWELANADIWCRGVARVANRVAAKNRPNVVFAVVPQAGDFPLDGVVSGATGEHGRVTARWNCWQYMTAAAKARTVFAPDGYTKVRAEFANVLTGSSVNAVRCSSTEAGDFAVGDIAFAETNGGVLIFDELFTITAKTGSGSTRDLALSPSLPAALSPGNHRLRRVDSIAWRFDGAYDYVRNAGWGVRWFGVFEHTVNNDQMVSDAHTALVWREDVKPWLRGLRDAGELACYVAFAQSSGGASGVNGWVDLSQELVQFGKMAWELNTGEVL